MVKKIGIILLIIIVVIIGAFGVYVGNYYKADDVAQAIYEENQKSLEFLGSDKSVGFIIYPGGKVDEVAYVRLAKLLNDEGYTAVVAKFPFNIGFMGINKADAIISEHSDIEKWYIVGHSLGGVTAGVYANENAEKLDGLVFLSSYSTEDLKDTELEVLSLKGSNDTVLNAQGYDEALANYDKEINGFTEVIIEGGNHAGYANYGIQEGDGTNDIGYEAQQKIVVDEILNLIAE